MAISFASFRFPATKACSLLIIDADLCCRKLRDFEPIAHKSSSAAATHGHTREDYEWDGDQVRQVAVSHARREQGHLEDLRPLHTAKSERIPNYETITRNLPLPRLVY
jgi:hypothetical protein